jgi:sialic acid synthase SpsE
MSGKTVIIAELGENHAGDWDLAERMLIEAAQSGADLVKFQSYKASEVAPSDPERDWFARVEVPDAVHFRLKGLADKCGVGFSSSCFSVNRARFLVEELGLRKIKVASSEMLNFPLLEYLNGRVDTVFLSTGMATLEEVRQAVGYLSEIRHLYLLHCTTQYPCPPQQVNLAAMKVLREGFPQHQIGYSDHTIGILAPIVAAALGAEVIEKHFTVDRSLPGTDHVLSALPDEFKTMVAQVREVEVLLGVPAKEPTEAELGIRDFVRQRFAK